MQTVAVVLERPEHLALRSLDLSPPGSDDVVVDVAWTGISTGTEKLLWSGRMPQFPGMGYPLVPGYETVGRVSRPGRDPRLHEGDMVFVPGANCFGEIKGLFGGAASRLVVSSTRLVPIAEELGETAILFALAATAHHAIAQDGGRMPELIVGHGILGRLIARIAVALGATAPTVWERNEDRRAGAVGYSVIDPNDDHRRDYMSIYDASGDSSLLDKLIGRLAKGGEIALAGFYEAPLSFAFPPAFMREARIRIAAEWKSVDMDAVTLLIESGKLNLSGLITHRQNAALAPDAYVTAFSDPGCLKMALDWRELA
jgi:3-hydroxyethyl bacteriochlorophyllide a dehydrogenase